jgi:vancomycin resistance protein YoaR
VEDVGGGVCQVATTVFRSAFWAGLPIVERNPHRYVVAIYQVKGGPVGLDAAIYDPGRDLRFKNSTSGYLLIQTDATDASNFTVSIYGAKPGWTVEMEGPDVTPGKPNGARLPDIQDHNLPAGTRIPVQPGQPGQNVTLTRIVKQGNTIVSRDTFATAYQPSNEQWVVGTKK